MSFEVGLHRVEDLIKAGLLEIGDGYRAKNSELSATGIPFARAGNINDGLQFQDADYFPEAELWRVGNKISRPGDVVFTSKGTVGRFALIETHSQRFVYSPQLCYWRSLDSTVIVPEYLYYWMSSQEFLHQVGYLKGQTDMADYVSLRDQRRMLVTIPAADDQRAVVSCLKPLDDRIALLRETNATLEAIAQAIFKSWFVDFDPVHAKAEGRLPEGMDEATAALFPDGFEESELGLIPRGWVVKSLDEIASFLNGLAMQKYPPESEEESIPVIKIAQLRSGDTSNADQASPNIKPEYHITNGDILFSWSGSLEVRIWLGGHGALNQHLFKVTSEEYPQWFYFLWVQEHLPAFRQIAASKATTMGHIQRKHLSEAKVVIPAASIFGSANDVLSPLFSEFRVNGEQIQTLTDLRDTLIPRLISGKLRLPEAKAIMDEIS